MPQSASATHTSFRPAGLVVQSFSYVAFAVSLGCAEVAWGLAFISVHQLTVWLCESAMPIAARLGDSIFFRYFNIGHGGYNSRWMRNTGLAPLSWCGSLIFLLTPSC